MAALLAKDAGIVGMGMFASGSVTVMPVVMAGENVPLLPDRPFCTARLPP